MTPKRPANLDLLIERYAEWRAEYVGEDAVTAQRQVLASIEACLAPGAVWAVASEVDRWVLAVQASPCWEWSAKSGSAIWDPLQQDLHAFLQQHPGADLVLIPRALPWYRLFQFLG